ncbi:MAG: helix-turn-helix domain-containing protein [Coriobacteriia bacterium]|nr:helix-turn-helix domain-containing protein [Coriobacteriia bacterium]
MNGAKRRLYPLMEAAEQLGVGRSKVYELIGSGALHAVKIGARTLIPAESLNAYVSSLVGNTEENPRADAN